MEIKIKEFEMVENYKEDNCMLGVFEVVQNASSNERNVSDNRWMKEVEVGVGNECAQLPAFFFVSVLEELKQKQKKAGKFNVAEVCREVQDACYPVLEKADINKISTGIRAYLKTLEIIVPIRKARNYKISDYDRVEKLIRNPFIAETKEWTA